MAHPFFEAGSYPWWIKPQASEFQRVLAVLYPQPGQIDAIYKSCAINPPPLFLGQAPDLIWHEALESLTPRGGLRNLCDVVRAEFEKIPQNAKVFLGVFDAIDPIKTVIFSEDLLVLDRKTFRAQLGELESEQSIKRVVLVRGGKFSGKSQGRYIFFEMAKAHGADAVYLCDGLVATVEEAIEKIFAALGKSSKDELQEKRTTDDAWYRAVCNRIHELASSAGRALWIAVDDLGSTPEGAPMLDTKIKEFFDQFAFNMLNPAFQHWFRLLLIHYPEGPVPTRWKKGYWAEDRADEADVQQSDIAEALQTWARQKQRTIVEDELQGLAAKAITAAENPKAGDARPRLERIHDAVMATLKELSV
jgi:hypothetical protein